MASPVAQHPRRGRRYDRILDSGYYFIGFLAFAVFASWPTYFGKSPASLDPYTHLHAIGMIVWLARRRRCGSPPRGGSVTSR